MDNIYIYPKDHTSWHYVDLEDFEYNIRMEERQQILASQRNLRRSKVQRRHKKVMEIKYFAIQKLVGLLLLATTFFIGFIDTFDLSFILLVIPISLMMIFTKSRYLIIKK